MAVSEGMSFKVRAEFPAVSIQDNPRATTGAKARQIRGALTRP
jgi:hypothetical protein